MHPLFRWAIAALLVGGAAFWIVTRPADVEAAAFAGLTADPARGETVFWASGCASCHTAPSPDTSTDTTTGDSAAPLPALGGGHAFASQFGTFYAPNISPDPDHGIGGWTVTDLARAMVKGVSPAGAHYYPVFPYTSYRHATAQDITDLHAFLMTLPADATPNRANDVGFPFNIRRSLGGWKLLFATSGWVLDGDLSPQLERGRYLVEGLGHCAECHTPRNALGGVQRDQWLAGAPNPSGKGRIPGITPATLDWAEQDIAYYLATGFTPEFDSAGGEMAAVVANMARLTDADRAAIAAYLKALPAGN